MNLPAQLNPVDKIRVPLSTGASVGIPITHITFEKWLGQKPVFDFGKKPLINYKGKCVFAEIAILRMLIASGWNGVWVETYGGCHFLEVMPKSSKLSEYSVVLPEDKKVLLEKIWQTGKTKSCFDIMAWKGDDIIFCEAKRKGKDKLTVAQIKFIKAALVCGISTNQLLIVEWK